MEGAPLEVEAPDARPEQQRVRFGLREAAASAATVALMVVALWLLVGAFEAIFLCAVFAFVLLRVRFPRIGALTERFFRAYWRLTFWLVAAFLPVVAARFLSDVVARSALPIALGVLLVWGSIFLLLVLQVATERRRRVFWTRAHGIDRLTPFLYTFSVAFVAVILFATITFLLAEHGAIGFAAGAAVTEPAVAADLFLWHLLDAVPALDVTRTLRWEEPLAYTDPAVGVLVLVFKVAVIIPVVAAFLAFWRYNRDGAGRPGDA